MSKTSSALTCAAAAMLFASTNRAEAASCTALGYVGPCAPSVVFGDVLPPAGVNFTDISRVVNTFRGLAGTTLADCARCDLHRCSNATQTCIGDGQIGFIDVSRAVDAFKGLGCQ
jgi:hypothetical protein